MVVKKKTSKVEAVALDEEKLHKLLGKGVKVQITVNKSHHTLQVEQSLCVPFIGCYACLIIFILTFSQHPSRLMEEKMESGRLPKPCSPVWS